MHRPRRSAVVPLVSVRAESVALSLSQVLWERLGPISIVVSEPRTHGRHRNASRGCEADDLTEVLLHTEHFASDLFIQEQVLERGVLLVSLHDRIEEPRPDDAP